MSEIIKANIFHIKKVIDHFSLAYLREPKTKVGHQVNLRYVTGVVVSLDVIMEVVSTP